MALDPNKKMLFKTLLLRISLMVGFAGGAEKADAAEPGGVGQQEGALQTAAHPGDPAEAAQVRQLRLQSSGKSPPGCALAEEGEKQGSIYHYIPV
jgi:hypothetical protein